MAGQVRVPELLDRDADEDEHEHAGHAPDNDESANAVGHLLEVGEVEDAVVHEQNGELCPHEVVDVEDLGDDEELGHQDYLVHGDLVCVDAHAGAIHGEDEADDDKVP